MKERFVYYEEDLRYWLNQKSWDPKTALQLLVGLYPQEWEELFEAIQFIRNNERVGSVVESPESWKDNVAIQFLAKIFKIGWFRRGKQEQQCCINSPAHKLICLEEDLDKNGLKLDTCNRLLEKGYSDLQNDYERYPQEFPAMQEHHEKTGVSLRFLCFTKYKIRSILLEFEHLYTLWSEEPDAITNFSPENWIEWAIKNDYWAPWASEAMKSFQGIMPLSAFGYYYRITSWDPSNSYATYDAIGQHTGCAVCHHWAKFRYHKRKIALKKRDKSQRWRFSSEYNCPLCDQWLSHRYWKEVCDGEPEITIRDASSNYNFEYHYKGHLLYSLRLDIVVRAWEAIQCSDTSPTRYFRKKSGEVENATTVKQQLIAWIQENYPEKKYPKLTLNAVDDLATVANWAKSDKNNKREQYSVIADKLLLDHFYFPGEERFKIPEYLDSNNPHYAHELAIAVIAWLILSEDKYLSNSYKVPKSTVGLASVTLKQALKDLILTASVSDIDDEKGGMLDRILTTANFDKKGTNMFCIRGYDTAVQSCKIGEVLRITRKVA